jgi:Ca2+-binding EF-hand superfamily protein
VTSWEAFVAVDADGNAHLAPSELYAFLRWLEVPDLTPEDVVDFFDLADKNRDGMIQYAEYMYVFHSIVDIVRLVGSLICLRQVAIR